MSSWINLADTVLDFSAVVSKIEDTASILSKDGTGLVKTSHACTVLTEDFLTLPEDTQECLKAAFELENPGSPVFLVPVSWRLPHVLKALGAFKSSSEAAKNGWNKDIEEGFSQHLVRLGHAKRLVSVFRPVSL